ncbi:MAG: hypothetical protein WA082_04285 [Candidatus Moraniibacteriota bacterium]
MKYWKLFLAGIVGLFLAISAQASLIMPDFADVPTGWTTDRYDPNTFANVGTFQGRNDVLGIGISAADGLTSRPIANQSQFYNTQGRQHAVSGGVGSILAADLYIPAAWRDGANGSVRTDMWGVMVDNTAAISDYVIPGFTNFGVGRYRVWDDIVWVDLAIAVVYDAWTSFEIHLTSNSYEYWVNGALAYTDFTINGTTGFSDVIMQGYNFCGDASLTGAVCADYTAHWDNARVAVVPEPGSFPLIGLALLALGSMRLLGRRGTHAKMA